MGRKKKKQSKPWCWYCNREFDDEKILIQHQKAKHFKCHICHKKLYTGPGLSIHCMQVHKETIDKVPNSLPNRSNIEIEIYGMEGIPPQDLKEHEKAKSGGDDEDEGPISKRSKSDSPADQASSAGAIIPGIHPGVPMLPSMPHLRPPFGVPGIPPWPVAHVSSAGGPPATYSGQPTGPNGIPNATTRPIFPAAATSASGASKTTFPAYGATSASGEKKPPVLNTTTATSKIVHPPEDISLEELRARLPKYAVTSQAPPPSATSVVAPVSSSCGSSITSVQSGISSPPMSSAPPVLAASSMMPPAISAAMNAPIIPPPAIMSMPLGPPVIAASPMMAMAHRHPGMIHGLPGPAGLIQQSPVMMAAGAPMVRAPFVPAMGGNPLNVGMASNHLIQTPFGMFGTAPRFR